MSLEKDRPVRDCALRVSKILLIIYVIGCGEGGGYSGKLWPQNSLKFI